MLQAEILVQYGMRSKAIERLQRIQELFPGEEERNQDLQQLYLAAGMNPRRPDAVVAHPPAPSKACRPSRRHVRLPLARRSPRRIDRREQLYQGGGNYPQTLPPDQCRCGDVHGGQRNRSAMEAEPLHHCHAEAWDGAQRNQGISRRKASNAEKARALNQLVTFVQDIVVSLGTLSLSHAANAPELEEIRDVVAELGIASLLALPLSDGEDQMGVLLLVQSTVRSWHSGDIVVLKTISEQIVIALNNAGLRRLVKSLSVTDEQSGLLKRASYLDLLMAETRRAVQQSTPVSVALMQFGKSGAMLKEHGEQAVEAAMQKIGQIFAANIRQNDLAFRYEMTTIALVLGETGEKEGLMAVEKLRKLLSEVKLSDEILPFSAGLVEAVVRQQFDPVDIVTEVINRADMALDSAVSQGMGRIVSLASLSSGRRSRLTREVSQAPFPLSNNP